MSFLCQCRVSVKNMSVETGSCSLSLKIEVKQDWIKSVKNKSNKFRWRSQRETRPRTHIAVRESSCFNSSQRASFKAEVDFDKLSQVNDNVRRMWDCQVFLFKRIIWFGDRANHSPRVTYSLEEGLNLDAKQELKEYDQDIWNSVGL